MKVCVCVCKWPHDCFSSFFVTILLNIFYFDTWTIYDHTLLYIKCSSINSNSVIFFGLSRWFKTCALWIWIWVCLCLCVLFPPNECRRTTSVCMCSQNVQISVSILPLRPSNKRSLPLRLQFANVCLCFIELFFWYRNFCEWEMKWVFGALCNNCCNFFSIKQKIPPFTCIALFVLMRSNTHTQKHSTYVFLRYFCCICEYSLSLHHCVVYLLSTYYSRWFQ